MASLTVCWMIGSGEVKSKLVTDACCFLFINFPQLNVFVASVEKEFLSLSNVLITIGWGGFQASVADHFKARHSADWLLCCVQTQEITFLTSL